MKAVAPYRSATALAYSVCVRAPQVSQRNFQIAWDLIRAISSWITGSLARSGTPQYQAKASYLALPSRLAVSSEQQMSSRHAPQRSLAMRICRPAGLLGYNVR